MKYTHYDLMKQYIAYLGPRDDQVYWFAGSFSRNEYSATIISGDT